MILDGFHIKAIGGVANTITDIDEKKGIVTGYFSHFGSKDEDGDIILKGAYSRTINALGPQGANRIAHLKDHDPKNAIGALLVLKEDDIGLYYESKIGRHDEGRNFLLQVEDGIIKEHSVKILLQKAVQKSDGNHVTEVKMYEGSSLQFWGANEHTPILGIKNFKQQEELKTRFDLLEKAMRNGKYTDDAFVKLEKELKAVKSLLSLIDTDTTHSGANSDTTDSGLKYDEAAEVIKQFRKNNFKNS